MTSDRPDPDAPPSAEEIAAAEALRVGLQDAGKENADAELLRAVAHAHNPKALDAASQRAAEEAALAKFDKLHARRTGGVVIRVAFGVGIAVAAAAALFFLLGRPAERPTEQAELVHVRSTQELFAHQFESRGGESARIDRIAVARANDLRENRFAQWGVSERRRR